MLILSRKKNQSIHIGGDIVVTVLDVSGENIKIGIDAPKIIQIYRSEVFEAIKQENKQAALTKINIDGLSKLFTQEES